MCVFSDCDDLTSTFPLRDPNTPLEIDWLTSTDVYDLTNMEDFSCKFY